MLPRRTSPQPWYICGVRTLIVVTSSREIRPQGQIALGSPHSLGHLCCRNDGVERRRLTRSCIAVRIKRSGPDQSEHIVRPLVLVPNAIRDGADKLDIPVTQACGSFRPGRANHSSPLQLFEIFLPGRKSCPQYPTPSLESAAQLSQNGDDSALPQNLTTGRVSEWS